MPWALCAWLLARLSVAQTRLGSGEKGHAAKSLKFDLYRVLTWKVSLNQTDSKHFYGPKRSQSQIAGGLNWQASIPLVCIMDFQADDYFELWQDRAHRKKRKLQLKTKFCFVFQHSFADKFSVSYAFFSAWAASYLNASSFCVVRNNNFK